MPENNKKKHTKNNPWLAQNDDTQASDKKKLYANEQASRAIGITGSVNVTGIYVMKTAEVLRALLNETLGYIFFPIAAALSITQAALMWREAKLNGMKKDSVARAALESVVAAAITTAVVGGIAASAAFASVGSFLILGAVGAKALFSSGAEIYYLIKFLKANTPEKKEEYKQKLIATGISLAAQAFALVAIGGVLVGGQYALAAFGIASGVVGGSYAAHGVYKAYKKHSKNNTVDLPETDTSVELNEISTRNTLTNNAAMTKILAQEKLPELDVTDKHIKKPKKKTKHEYIYTFSNDETKTDEKTVENKSGYTFS